MKISSRLISITSVIIAIALLLSITVGLFVSQNKRNGNIVTNANDSYLKNWNFFNDIKNRSGSEINLVENIDKLHLLYKFTDFQNHHDINRVIFFEKIIHKNILDFISKLISQHSKFKDINNYYIKIQYEVINDSIYIDSRWALKDKITNKKATTLYFSQFIISITQ